MKPASGRAQTRDEWLHEIKFDDYRMAARIEPGKVELLTRTGLNWTEKYRPIAKALSKLPVQTAYLDGELCGMRSDGTTSFSMIQAASETGNAAALVFFLFDYLHLDGEDLAPCLCENASDAWPSFSPVSGRRSIAAITRSAAVRNSRPSSQAAARRHRLETRRCRLRNGKSRAVAKVKCLNREEFVVVGWTDPDGSRPHLGSLLPASDHSGDGYGFPAEGVVDFFESAEVSLGHEGPSPKPI